MEDLCKLKTLGRHILAEFFHCDVDKLNDPVAIQDLMLGAANACGATVVQTVFHSFNPHGVSGVVVIAESHLAIHTWPEYGHAAVDVFTCGDTIDPSIAVEYLREGLSAREVSSQEVSRLQIPTPTMPAQPKNREFQEVESTSPD
jgi:S-adenosylmethionine decarboxylase proenzyme